MYYPTKKMPNIIGNTNSLFAFSMYTHAHIRFMFTGVIL